MTEDLIADSIILQVMPIFPKAVTVHPWERVSEIQSIKERL